MDEDGEVTAGLVRDYFIKNGGKVKRHDLFDHFRRQLDECADQGKLKNQFGDIVNSLAFLQNFEGEKYFVLKKNKNGTTPVLLRRQLRGPGNQRKEKGVSLPANMRGFRFSSAEDASGNIHDNKASPGLISRYRPGFRSESISAEVSLRRNNSDTSISENGHAQDSGVDTAVSSLQSESPKLGPRQGSLPRSTDSDRLSQYSGDTGIQNDDDQYDHEIYSHVLDGFEKSWMMSSMLGNKSDIVCHIEQDPNIVMYKDFIMTGLHWAAKQGNSDIVCLLANAGANVNAKSGYTPLHLAAMHGQIFIMDILIDEYNVDVHIRDHSGKEPKDVVKKNSSDQIKLKLKDPIAALALQDLDKKLPSSTAPPAEGKMKRLSKILSRKPHNSTAVDDEYRSKIARTVGESMASPEDDEEEEDVFELYEIISEEPIKEEDNNNNNNNSMEIMNTDETLGDPMRSEGTLEETRG